jgi:hypothetical protein
MITISGMVTPNIAGDLRHLAIEATSKAELCNWPGVVPLIL